MNRPTIATDPSGEIAPALAGCLLGGSLSVFGSILNGDSFGVGACKAELNCLASGAMAQPAVIAPVFGGCLAGLAGGAAQPYIDSYCDGCPSKPKPCQLMDLLTGMLTGCGTGGIAEIGAIHHYVTELAAWAWGNAMHQACMSWQ